MKESEWIVSPKQLKENQRKAIARETVSIKEDKFDVLLQNALCFMAGVMTLTLIVCLIA